MCTPKPGLGAFLAAFNAATHARSCAMSMRIASASKRLGRSSKNVWYLLWSPCNEDLHYELGNIRRWCGRRPLGGAWAAAPEKRGTCCGHPADSISDRGLVKLKSYLADDARLKALGLSSKNVWYLMRSRCRVLRGLERGGSGCRTGWARQAARSLRPACITAHVWLAPARRAHTPVRLKPNVL